MTSNFAKSSHHIWLSTDSPYYSIKMSVDVILLYVNLVCGQHVIMSSLWDDNFPSNVHGKRLGLKCIHNVFILAF